MSQLPEPFVCPARPEVPWQCQIHQKYPHPSLFLQQNLFSAYCPSFFEQKGMDFVAKGAGEPRVSSSHPSLHKAQLQKLPSVQGTSGQQEPAPAGPQMEAINNETSCKLGEGCGTESKGSGTPRVGSGRWKMQEVQPHKSFTQQDSAWLGRAGSAFPSSFCYL